jgi:PIN domain nuclease of toxin-antitoxin system
VLTDVNKLRHDCFVSVASLRSLFSSAESIVLFSGIHTHTEEFDQLPKFKEHADPFDRILIAQAMAEDYTLVSPDTRFPLYEPHGLKLLWD